MLRTHHQKQETILIRTCVCFVSDNKSAVHSITSGDMGKKILAIKASSKSEEICAKLAFIYSDRDAFVLNMKYYINCLRIHSFPLYHFRTRQYW